MPAATLDQVKRLADSLAPVDQVRLIEYLVPRLAQAVALTLPASSAEPDKSSDAWDEFLRLGEELARRDRPGTPTMTEGVLSSRR